MFDRMEGTVGRQLQEISEYMALDDETFRASDVLKFTRTINWWGHDNISSEREMVELVTRIAGLMDPTLVGSLVSDVFVYALRSPSLGKACVVSAVRKLEGTRWHEMNVVKGSFGSWLKDETGYMGEG